MIEFRMYVRMVVRRICAFEFITVTLESLNNNCDYFYVCICVCVSVYVCVCVNDDKEYKSDIEHRSSIYLYNY